MNQTINFLGESDFLDTMRGEVADFLRDNVTDGFIKGPDGTKIHYYKSTQENAKARVVIVHGMCEFFGKYHEMAWYMHRAGCDIYFIELRGHGKSGGKRPEPDDDIICQDDFDSYVEDLKVFMDEVVAKDDTRPLILFGHSMGGAISALFSVKYPDYFDKLILSSPMLRLKAANFSAPKLAMVKAYVAVAGKKNSPAPGQNHFNPEPKFEGGSAQSRPRYDYMFAQRLEDRDYQTYGGTFGWVLAGVVAIRKIMAGANKIKVPVTLFTAGKDHLIDQGGYEEFVKRCPGVKRFHYPNSAHELFNANEEERKKYFADLLGEIV